MDRHVVPVRQKTGSRLLGIAVLVSALLWAVATFAGDPPVIEFFTIDAGAGHAMIEKAVKSSLEKSPYGQTVLIPEKSTLVNDHLTKFGNFKLSKSYVLMAKYAPWMWEFTYSTLPKITTREMKRSMYRGLITPQLIAALTKDKPDLIYCTQPMLAEFIDVLKEDGYIDPKVKVVNMVTDYSVTEAYNTRGLVIVPHQSLKDKLVAMGKDPNLVKVVSGIPAREQFREPYDKAEVRKLLAAKIAESHGGKDLLGTKDPFFLAFGGGEGLGLDKVIDFLPNWHPDRNVNLAVVCGHNEALFNQLEKMMADGKIDPKITIIPEGFIRNIDEYMKAADVIVSKPGGSVTAETGALMKGLFAHTYVPGQERMNFDQLTKLGVIQGLDLKDLNNVGKILEREKVMEETVAREFPNAKAIPDQINRLVEDYASGKIAESPSEQAELQRMIEKKKGKSKNKEIAAAKPKQTEPVTPAVGSQKARDTIVISDVDDTIRLSEIFGVNTVINYATTELPFAGASDLYRNLSLEGAQFAYVSSVPKALSGMSKNFLKENKFPEGAFYARTTKDRSLHKELAIRQIIQENPGKKVVLIGDNGETVDSETFARLQKDPKLAGVIDGAYIHEIFDRPGRAPLPEGQRAFLTTADLAVALNQRGLISEAEAQAQLKSLTEHLKVEPSNWFDWSADLRRHKAFPEFANVSPARIQEIIRRSEDSLPAGSEMKKGLEVLENGILEQRYRRGKLSCLRNLLLGNAAETHY